MKEEGEIDGGGGGEGRVPRQGSLQQKKRIEICVAVSARRQGWGMK